MLLRQLAKAGTLLTLCPVSNAGLGGVATVQEVPIRDLLEAGVRLSINGDDPAYFGADLSGDYCAVQEALHLSMTECAMANPNQTTAAPVHSRPPLVNSARWVQSPSRLKACLRAAA
ncbi:adenosine deaminase [Beauveria bassiana ARSEF 2860]|uniref:Adenosine deaminase n=1 Tax=Beauveria bassiana (strain ARSEF 2860) TaxID=655819 RepID=J5J457_BEAB2|nr:adenosine deaminase [Beauveria bassiana ARSEF 2860]EJP61483.1 adenosine deaminase [Beauveria bassiana ARSEF 2860]